MELLQMMKSRRGGEILGILILAAGVTIAASLITYHPDDPSAFYTSTSNEISNAIGYYGATLASVLIGFIGIASLIIPGVLLLIGWNRFWGKELEYMHTKFIGFVVLLLSVPPLLDLLFGDVWFRGALIRTGGYLGREIDAAVTSNLNSGGAAIALITLLLIGLLLATRISLAAIFLAAKEGLLALGRMISLRWARFSERRRKEKMKTEVIRKHLEREEAPEPESPRAAYIGDSANSRGMVVREVKGHGRFQIRKVTKAELRKAAEALATSEAHPSELYARREEEQDLAPVAPFMRDMDATMSRRRPPRPTAPERVERAERMERPERSEPSARPLPRPQARETSSRTRETKFRQVAGELPPLNLLKEPPKQETINDDLHRKYLEVGKQIEERCKEFSVDGEVTAYHPGPVVTTFEFKPGPAVKYAKVVNLGDDLALSLKAESMRIERISGSSTVGIEVPNKKRELIALREIIDSEQFVQSQSLMTLALGKDIHGDPIVTDLAKMPHLLVAGATGAGKSVGLNSMIVSLLYKALPKQLKLLMIDPKMVELKIYEDIPHLLHPIVTDPKLASNALLWAVNEMENRYRTLAECGVRNIDQYNALLKDPEALRRARKNMSPDEQIPEPLTYIVIIIDEFADLMMVASKDVEDSVTRIAQKARAVGIHLIIATQRPSVDVITGVIKANFPSRISYQVASKIDSRTILDTQGAEKLLGNGDMLFLPPGTARIRRIHGAYVSESEISEIVEFVKENQGRPQFIEEITKSTEEKNGADGIEYLSDPKYDEAVRVVLSTGQASASYLQRRLKLGYSRAARLIEIMEANGVVGPSQGSKPREILIRPDDYPPAQEA
jgi:S-DNA-T family DNA segregation ATPase FtsK/SpoIIIE